MSDDIFAGFDKPSASIPMPAASTPGAPENELHEYFIECSKHDWYYNYSDDHGVWQRGEAANRKLVSKSNKDHDHQRVFQAWHGHMFSGDPWATERQPKPIWEDFK